MRRLLRKSKEGFTLIELMIVVAIIGILAVLAIYGVRKYLANAKTAEARNSLGQIAKDAASAAEREKGTQAILTPGNTSLLFRSFCATAGNNIPTAVPHAQKYQSAIAEWNSGDALTGWQCLKFSLEEPQYYQYGYTSGATSAISGAFTAIANGDLNGDNVLSTFTIAGSATNGGIAISPNIQEVSPEE